MVKNTLNRWDWERWNKQESKVNPKDRDSKQISKNQEQQEQDRFMAIKEQIQRGDYKIDLAKTSKKMALNLLNLQD